MYYILTDFRASVC